LGLVFQAVSSVSLAVVTTKLLLDLLRDRKESRHRAQATEGNLGPLVRREVERALAEHHSLRGRGT
jgi:membrane protein implicated in regulation of membrane protease activity